MKDLVNMRESFNIGLQSILARLRLPGSLSLSRSAVRGAVVHKKLHHVAGKRSGDR